MLLRVDEYRQAFSSVDGVTTYDFLTQNPSFPVDHYLKNISTVLYTVAVFLDCRLLNALSTSSNFQIQYQLVFCLWCMTFNPDLAERMNKYNVIPVLAAILQDSQKEKVFRIILATFRVRRIEALMLLSQVSVPL